MTPLPRQVLVAPLLEHHALADPAAVLRQRLDGDWPHEDWRGRPRGCRRREPRHRPYRRDGRTVVAWLEAHGADPFVVPAMGSHGGATPEGQRACSAPTASPKAQWARRFEASMDVDELGETASGVAPWSSSRAFAPPTL